MEEEPNEDYLYYLKTPTYDVPVEVDVHEYEWCFVESPSEESFCFKCKKILNKPVLTECCGIHLCTSCAELDIPGDSKLSQCPQCSFLQARCMLNKSKWRGILRLRVFCPLKERGCEWEGELKACHEHLLSNCHYMDFKCANGCGESLERHQITDHFENLCPKRSAVCVHCKTTGQYEDIIGDHLLVCPEYYVLCPNRCGEGFNQAFFDEHMETCPELSIPCNYRFAGCDVLTKRKDMPQHLEDQFQQHLQLQTMYARNSVEKSKRTFEQYAEESEKRLYEFVNRDSLESRKSHLKDKISQTETEHSRTRQRMNEVHEHHELTMKVLFSKHTNDKLLWELDRRQLQLVSKITSGPLTEVWKGQEFGYKTVAIKKQKLGTVTSSMFLQEAYLLKQLQHRNVVQLLGVSTTQEPFLIVTGYMNHGNLSHYFRNEGKNLSLKEQLSIIQQVALGMAYLEGLHLIHRSLTSRSILVGNDLRCKIGSFTQSRILKDQQDEFEIPQGERVSFKSAPEVITKNRCSIKSDVWSFGILQYEVMTCKALKMSDVEDFIESGCKMNKPAQCSHELYRIMEQCWNENPMLRPSFSTLVDQLNDL